MTEISLKGLSKATVLAALYNAAQPQGMGFLHYDPTPMSEKEAEDLLARGTDFDYLKGRVMKVNLSGDTFDPWLFNRDHGDGAAQAAIDSLMKTGDSNSPEIERSHSERTFSSAMKTESHLDDESRTSRTHDGTIAMELGLSDVKKVLAPKIKKAIRRHRKSQSEVSGQSLWSKIKTALFWRNISKIPTTLIAILTHFGIGICRLVTAFVLAIKLIPSAFKIAFEFVRMMFSFGYQNTWNSIYARIASPACQICGKQRTKGHSVVFAEGYDHWSHSDCQLAREVAVLLNNKRYKEAAIIMAMSQKGGRPLPLKIIVQSLRSLKDPYTHDLYRTVKSLRFHAEKMDSVDVLGEILSLFSQI